MLARQVAAENVTINNLLPGRFDTDRLRENPEFAARRAGRSAQEEEELALGTIPARRFGHPDEFGASCAFLCSAHAGYMTGQNIVLDGGSFRGLV